MKKVVGAALSTLILACLCAVGLTAQTQEEQSDIEVIVTASRVEESAEEVPAYVTVITAEELTASGQTTLVDALDGLAGIHFRSFSGNSAKAEISMRGFGDNAFGRVLVLLNGRRLNRPDMSSINWLEIPVQDVERVEVVRGGSSVLYGDNAVAGVINIITKSGSDEFGFNVTGSYGSFGQNQEAAGVSGSIGALRLSANAEHSATEGYRDRSAYRSLGGSVTLGLDLERFSSSLALSYNRLYYQLPGPLEEVELDADPTQAGNPSDESNDQYANANLGLTYEASENLLMDGTLSYSLKLIQSDIPSNFTAKYSDLLIHSVALSPKFQVDMEVLRGNRLILGIDGYFDHLGLDLFTNAQRTTTTDEYKIGRVAAGVYATDNLDILPMLTLSGGVRYEIVYLDAQTLKNDLGSLVDDDSMTQSIAFDTGLLLHPFPESKLWASFGTVFRNPFVDEVMDLYGFGMSPAFNTDLKPEIGWNLEVGTEITVMRLLKLVGTAFWLEMEDEIGYDFGTGLNVNLDDTRHLGVEAEAGLTIPRLLDLSSSYAYTVAEFRGGPNTGNRIPLVPTHRLSGEAVLHLPLDLNLQASARYVSEMYSGADYDNSLPMLEDYALFDLFLSWAPEFVAGDLELYFGVDNILDTVYASMGYDYFSYVVYYPGEGRSWKVGASYRY